MIFPPSIARPSASTGVFNRLDGLVGQEAKTYPPYNIEKVGD